MHLIVDCATGEARYVPPSPEEEAAVLVARVLGVDITQPQPPLS